MCGIFGVTITGESELKPHYKRALKELYLLSESRGKEASGFALNNGTQLSYLKTPFPASELIKSTVFDRTINTLLSSPAPYYAFTGHSRLVTNGYEQDNQNNQPVVRNGMTVVHNGIIVNTDELWAKNTGEEKTTALDTEIIPVLVHRYYSETGNLQQALQQLYAQAYGMASIAILLSELENMLLATNNGSLYYVADRKGTALVFASEQYILHKFIENLQLGEFFDTNAITHLQANSALLVNLRTSAYDVKDILQPGEDFTTVVKATTTLPATEISEPVSSKPVYLNTSMEYTLAKVPEGFIKLAEERSKRIAQLKRCTRCILPETFPYIQFDTSGVCNYCNNYTPIPIRGIEEFKTLLNSYRTIDASKHDCLVPFSGGRDSSFVLHYLKKEMGMNPIAFSYDWGMLTGLARRNQSRMCGKLGVEHILVSADIRKKRANIRKNVLAWLKRPRMGTIPLFMAGDKQYFYYTNLLMEQNKLGLSIMGENMLETTRFKSGFAGIKPVFNSKHTYTLRPTDKLKMVLYYGKEYLLNPAYINSSLVDTVDAFKSYYVIQHQNVNIFDYMPWKEEEIERILINEYDWETDPETETTWRIGDGTTAFYNYIYYMVTGFTENDTFRSNQVREGLITREKAMERTTRENLPRWQSLQWYCNTINIDWKQALETIHQIPTLYP